MDKLSGYIPFLIMLAVGIISAARKAKKQPAKEGSWVDEAFPTIPQLPLIQEKPVPEKKIVTPVASRIPVPEKNQQAVYEQPIDIQDIDEYGGINIDLSDPEEVRRAIIYSEIFNKKDF